MSCGVGRRLGSDPAFLWLWQRPAATAPIRPLAWEPPYAMGAAQEKAKRKKKEKKKRKKKRATLFTRELVKNGWDGRTGGMGWDQEKEIIGLY